MEQDLARARTFTKVLDRYGLDPLLGFLLPGVGDLVGSLLGLYLVIVAAKHKASPLVIARMLMNLAFDALIGFTPVVGDIADVLFHANERNLALLEARPTGRAKASDWILVVGAVVALLSVVGVVIYGFVRLVQWL
jgi:hypothetical protein